MSRPPKNREVVALPESDRFEGAPHPRETLGFFGNAAAERELLDAYRNGRMAQAWILGGPEGIGKATLAWRLARFLLAHPDPAGPEVQSAESLAVAADSPAARKVATLALADIFLLRRTWNDKAKPGRHYTEIRVDDVREIISALHQSSGSGGWRVAIVDCVDEMNASSANALLKLIEEPPDRALFLLVAHQPGRMLPTIRSRCRKLMLTSLQEDEIATAVRGLGAPWSETPDDRLRAAAAGADGSVRAALELIGGEGVLLHETMRALFARLPNVDWIAVHTLADKLSGRAADAAFAAFLRALQRHLNARVRALAAAGAPPERLIGFARAWEESLEAARESEVFNFDRKALTLGVFERLAKAERAAL